MATLCDFQATLSKNKSAVSDFKYKYLFSWEIMQLFMHSVYKEKLPTFILSYVNAFKQKSKKIGFTLKLCMLIINCHTIQS